MAEPKENYWSKHHTGIIQCLFAFYCCVIATIAYLYPRAAPPATASAAANTGGTIMHSSYSMPFWLWIGIVGLSLSVIVPAVIGMIRKRRAPEEIQRLKDSLYGSARSNLEYRAERDQCREEKRELGKQIDAVFSPLQIEALTLAKQLGELLREVPPPKVISNKDYPDTHEGQVQFNIALCLRAVEYNVEFAKVTDRYAREFAPRVKDVVLQFGQEGFNEPELRQFFDCVNTSDDLMRVRAKLVCLAYRKDGIQLSYEEALGKDDDPSFKSPIFRQNRHLPQKEG